MTSRANARSGQEAGAGKSGRTPNGGRTHAERTVTARGSIIPDILWATHSLPWILLRDKHQFTADYLTYPMVAFLLF